MNIHNGHSEHGEFSSSLLCESFGDKDRTISNLKGSSKVYHTFLLIYVRATQRLVLQCSQADTCSWYKTYNCINTFDHLCILINLSNGF